MIRALVGFLVVFILLSSCAQRVICPAYQSAFIYDKEALRKKFSYFDGDTTPKVFSASKTKYLIAEPVSYRKKVRSLQTVPARKVMVVVPDSLSGGTQGDSAVAADLDRAARSVNDTTIFVDEPAADTVAVEEEAYVISKDREVRVLKYDKPDTISWDPVQNKYVTQKPKYYVEEVGFNTEQDNYMWYLRHSLVLPDVRLAKLQSGDDGSGKGGQKKRGKKGGLKNLFRKSKEADTDSAELELPPTGEEEFNFIDTTAYEDPAYQQPQRNELRADEEESVTGQGGNRKPKKNKRRKKKDAPAADPVTPAKKKADDEDDGF